MDGENHDTDLKQVQALAVSEDGIHFENISNNPVIQNAQEGNIHPAHFRDPKVWKRGKMYYCVLGSKSKENKGQVLLYKSKDLISWEFINVAVIAEGNMGYMWECPDIFSLGEADILMMSPQGLDPEGVHYHNLHQSGYLVGKLSYEEGKYKQEPFRILDYGFDFYASQSILDDQGRRRIIAWMDMWESHIPNQAFNWAGAMTLPRLLELKDNKIYVTTIPELTALRENEKSYQNIVVKKLLN